MEISTDEFFSALNGMLHKLGERTDDLDARSLQVRQLKLIIHVGTPKTGTTSIQTYLNKKQRKLRGLGYLYPHGRASSPKSNAPTHQWFEKNLVSFNLVSLLENFKNVLAQVKPDTHTIILSSEGIYNCWWDFPDASKDVLAKLASLFETTIWVWFREPVSFTESYYKQCIRNPQVSSNECYGKDLSLLQMLEIPWFSRHLDYQGFVDECAEIFGLQQIQTHKYNDDSVQVLSQKLGLATAHDNPTPRQNQSLNTATIGLLKVLNRYDIKPKDKAEMMTQVSALNDLLKPYSTDSMIDDATRQKIMDIARPLDKQTNAD